MVAIATNVKGHVTEGQMYIGVVVIGVEMFFHMNDVH